jgi:hypothetical protein
VGEILAAQELTYVCALVLLVRSVLKMVGKVRNSLVLGEDVEFGTVSERGTEEFHVVVPK